tara:strand:+ start:1307 stop:1609 length:303 start_codon:yes stop_codon:yes gene_type:complete
MNPMSILPWLWSGLPWYVQWGVIAFIAFTSIGGVLSLYNFIRSFAGKWSIPAMLSLVIPAGLWVMSLLKNKPISTEQQYGMPAPKAKPRRPTIFDGLRRK